MRKEADANDKRMTHLKVTDIGEQLLQSIIPTPLFVNACESLTKDVQNDIDKALKQLLIAILKSNHMKSFDVCHSCHYNEKRKDGY